MIKFNRRQKIIFKASILLLLALIGLGLGINTVWAQPATPGAGAGNSELGTLAEMGLKIALGFLTILQSVLSTLVIYLGNIFDLLLGINIKANPIENQVTIIGWGIMRDLVNSLFILLILWIAFTIIFNLENLGGKKLLTNIIVIALLVNFSLAFVGAIFGFANVFSKSLSDALPHQTEIKDGQEITRFMISDYLGQILNLQSIYALSPQEASSVIDALLVGAGTGCGIGAIWGLAPCIPGAIAGGAVAAFLHTVFSGDDPSKLISTASTLLVVDLYLFFIFIAFLLVSISLVLRLVAMTLIGVFAPAAFLMFALPGGTARKYWNMWLDYLIRWAFFAPVFVFLLYLSLYFLNEIHKKTFRVQNNVVINPVWDPDYILMIITSLSFLLAAIMIARKMGGAIAEAVIKYGEKYGVKGLKYAGAFPFVAGAKGLRTIAAPVAGQIAKSEKLSTGLLSNVPGAKALQRGAARLAAGERGAIAAAEKQYSRYTADELSRMLPGEYRPANRVAILKQLGEKKGIEKLSDAQAEAEFVRLNNLGEDIRPLLKQKPSVALRRPDLALTPAEIAAAGPNVRREAVKKITDTMAGDELAKINKDLANPATPEGQDVLWALWHSSDRGARAQIGVKNKELAQNMKSYVEKMSATELDAFKKSLTPDQLRELNREFDLSLAGSTGTGIRPLNWAPVISARSLSSGKVLVPYSEKISITGGSPPYKLNPITAPPGLGAYIIGNDVGITGTPAAKGKFSLSFEITDTAGGSTTKSYNIIIT